MKQNQLIFILAFFLLMLIMVAGCHGERASISQEATATSTPSIKPTRTATLTRTKLTTRWPTRTITPTRTTTNTQTSTTHPKDFDASTIISITPANPAKCPMENTSVEFAVEELIKFHTPQEEEPFATDLDMDAIMTYLNKGVPLETMLASIQNKTEYNRFLNKIRIVDVTGDGINDLVFPENTGVAIFGCEDQKYTELGFLFSQSALSQIHYIKILDANNDGLNDIIVEFSGCIFDKCPYLDVFTWNGRKFISIADFRCSVPSIKEIKDIDNNGTLELVQFYKARWNTIPEFGVFPERDYTQTCMWNGEQFTIADSYTSDPIYRAQAYLDAVSYTNRKDYEKAIELYLQVIHDEKLLWYLPGNDQSSRNYWSYRLETAAAESPEIVNDPMYGMEFKKDIYEYPLLASASYYRMMLIYLQQDDIKNAETMLVILKDAYGTGKTGEHITKIAEMVLENYIETNNLEQSCPEAVEYLDSNWDTFTADLTYLYLTDFYWGPQYWCPHLPERYGEE